MFEHESIGKIPWRSKRTVADVNRFNETGREAKSDEGLDRIGDKNEIEQPLPLPENIDERARVMMDFLHNLPEVKQAAFNLNMPAPTVAWRNITILGLRLEIRHSDRKDWKEKPFYYLDVGIEFERKEKALQEQDQKEAADKEQRMKDIEEKANANRKWWPLDSK